MTRTVFVIFYSNEKGNLVNQQRYNVAEANDMIVQLGDRLISTQENEIEVERGQEKPMDGFDKQAKEDHSRADDRIEEVGETDELSSYYRMRAEWNEWLSQNEQDRHETNGQ